MNKKIIYGQCNFVLRIKKLCMLNGMDILFYRKKTGEYKQNQNKERILIFTIIITEKYH